MRIVRLVGIDNIVSRHRVNGNGRQGAVDQHIMTGGITVACLVGDVCRYRVVSFTQCANCRGWHRGAPVAGSICGGGVILPVQRHRYRGARWLITGTGNLQIRAFFRGVNHVIGGDGVDANGWRGEIHGDRAAGVIAVACRVGNCGRDVLRAAAKRGDIRQRNADAPVAGSVQRGGVGFTV